MHLGNEPCEAVVGAGALCSPKLVYKCHRLQSYIHSPRKKPVLHCQEIKIVGINLYVSRFNIELQIFNRSKSYLLYLFHNIYIAPDFFLKKATLKVLYKKNNLPVKKL